MSEKTLMKGNNAIAAGAIRAGCRFFAGYPITPQNEIPEYMSLELPKIGGVFIQAESEVSAINMLYGSSACGARAMTSSSGPGISLKQEGISYLCGAELPIFYANIMRGGPGLGNIAPSQGDYFQSTRGGGHGDYRVIVMAPASVSELANFPKKCFELAEKYRNPAMVLADGVLGQMMEPVEFDFDPVDLSKLPEPGYVLGCSEGRERRRINSLYMKPGALEDHNYRLQEKYNTIKENEVLFEANGIDDADIVLIAFGTAARVCKSAMALGREKGVKIGWFRPITLWPFPMKELSELADRVKKMLVVEMNLGQMVEDVKIAVEGKSRIFFYGRPAGGIPTPEDVFDKIKKSMDS